MEQVAMLFIMITISALVALVGKDRKIGYGWSFVLCIFLSPILGLIAILFSKKNAIEFVEANRNH